MTATRARKTATPQEIDADGLMSSLVSEAQVQADVIAYLQARGFLVAHHPDSRRLQGNPGLTDLVVVGHGAVLFIEMKREDGRRSPEQLIWASAIRETSAHYFVWKPSDWRSGRIEKAVEKIIRASVAH